MDQAKTITRSLPTNLPLEATLSVSPAQAKTTPTFSQPTPSMSNNQRPESPSPATQLEANGKYDYLHNDKIRGNESRLEEVKSLATAIKKNLAIKNKNFGEQLNPVSKTEDPASNQDDRPSEHALKMFGSRKNGHSRAPSSSNDVGRVSPPTDFSATHVPRLNVAEVAEVSSPRAEYSPRVEYLSDRDNMTEPSLHRVSSAEVIPSPRTAFSPRP